MNAVGVRVLCGNEDHLRPTPAAAQLAWPSGRFNPGTACKSCLEMLLHLYVLPGPALIEGPYAVSITPVEGDRLSPCGTRAAYIRHRKHGEEPCDACKRANAAAELERVTCRTTTVPPDHMTFNQDTVIRVPGTDDSESED